MTPGAATAPVAVAWLITIRWLAILAGVAALVAGRNALQVQVPVASTVTVLGICAISNAWLMGRSRRGHATRTMNVAGVLVCADVLVLSWLLLNSGGVLNPASVFYLVEIVVVALVLGRTWTWIVTALSVGGYAALFLFPPDELAAAQAMHPEISLHMRGMWFAFALTALVIAALVTRLAIAVERRDLALAALRDQADRATRVAGLATLAAGTAHELSTPLSTIAVAARELDRALAGAEPKLVQDARLIRAETDRCRQILESMVGRSGETTGEAPRAASLSEVVQAVRGRLPVPERDRVVTDIAEDVRVVWPIQVVARAIANLVQNGLHASAAGGQVRLRAEPGARDMVRLAVIDQGAGMPQGVLDRAGEPFFTTKAPGAGTGLGLFVARASAEQLGGSLSLASAPGTGTTATLTLPRDVIHRDV